MKTLAPFIYASLMLEKRGLRKVKRSLRRKLTNKRVQVFIDLARKMHNGAADDNDDFKLG